MNAIVGLIGYEAANAALFPFGAAWQPVPVRCVACGGRHRLTQRTAAAVYLGVSCAHRETNPSSTRRLPPAREATTGGTR